ncbi:hypothetical protein BHE74_00002646 [Ensete ventricosum]|nr:hypothetical protein BHE74_00002646 [Ensete ventricosum]
MYVGVHASWFLLLHSPPREDALGPPLRKVIRGTHRYYTPLGNACSLVAPSCRRPSSGAHITKHKRAVAEMRKGQQSYTAARGEQDEEFIHMTPTTCGGRNPTSSSLHLYLNLLYHSSHDNTSKSSGRRPMGRHMNQYDKEYLKMAIMKQEATFRQQVHELHHLYHVQQLLMREMNNNTNNKDAHNRTPDLKLPAGEFRGEKDRNVSTTTVEADRESDLELTLATGSSARGKRKETSSASDSGSSFSSSSTQQSGGTKRSSNGSGQCQVRDMRFQRGIEERMREDGIKQPPWFSRCLSLNMA